MQVFTAKDVERVLGISKGALRALIRGGFVAPARGRRRQYVFSFRDLAALRAARTLLRVRVSPHRITGAFAQLRRQAAGSPSNVKACGTELVVWDECGLWRNASGQFLLQLEATSGSVVSEAAVPALDILNGAVLNRAANEPSCEPPAPLAHAEALFDEALHLEGEDANAAIHGYRLCLEIEPSHSGARLNWGRLLQSSGLLAEAEAVYRGGLAGGGEDDSSLLFNLALVLEETGRELEAIDCYKRALERDSEQADVHFNLARLYQQLGMQRAAIRHFNEFRRINRD